MKTIYFLAKYFLHLFNWLLFRFIIAGNSCNILLGLLPFLTLAYVSIDEVI